MDDSARYLATFNGKTLPGFIRYSASEASLDFDAEKYMANGISPDEVDTIRNVISQVDYKRCRNGCDIEVSGYFVTVDKLKRSISIRDSREDFYAPETTFGLVNNQSVDLRASSDGYRAANLNGATWVGLPSRSFGYVSWYVNHTEMRGRTYNSQDVSSYYLQKNFARTYVRAGKQNAVDYSSGSVSTLLAPSFDQFVTIGSQTNLQVDRNAGSLVMYATAEGNYEFYRNGRLILKRPAMLGRNEINFADLPGGYYSVQVRLVDRNGNVVSEEIREINNVNFGASSGNAWHFTIGREMSDRGGFLMEAAVSRNFRQFYMNASTLVGHGGDWAAEVNVTRPTKLGDVDITPTLGLMAGERKAGGYVSLSASSEMLGSLSASHYLHNDVSRFYWGTSSTSLSYSRIFRKVTFGYNYQKSSFGNGTHQAEARWAYQPNGLWAMFALGVQKGSFTRKDGGYGVYFNMTVQLDKVHGSLNAARAGGQTQMSADYRKDITDNFGTTTLGVTGSRVNTHYGVNVYGTRAGTRGDTSLNLGHTAGASNIDFNYRGMVAANKDGVALGRYSGSGSAMMLNTPKIDGMTYGFNVEGSPVGGGSAYAVPLNAYADVPFARVFSNSEKLDMNIEVPANVVRAHPGQVYPALAKVDINMIYSGFLKDAEGKPVSGTIVETGDTVYRNGLFSIVSKEVLPAITVNSNGQSYTCTLKNAGGSGFRCELPAT